MYSIQLTDFVRQNDNGLELKHPMTTSGVVTTITAKLNLTAAVLISQQSQGDLQYNLHHHHHGLSWEFDNNVITGRRNYREFFLS